MSSSKKVYLAPILPRATSWTLEKISALSLPEMKQLAANAERLGETEISALCAQAIKIRPKPVVVRKPVVKKTIRKVYPSRLTEAEETELPVAQAVTAET